MLRQICWTERLWWGPRWPAPPSPEQQQLAHWSPALAETSPAASVVRRLLEAGITSVHLSVIEAGLNSGPLQLWGKFKCVTVFVSHCFMMKLFIVRKLNTKAVHGHFVLKANISMLI